MDGKSTDALNQSLQVLPNTRQQDDRFDVVLQHPDSVNTVPGGAAVSSAMPTAMGTSHLSRASRSSQAREDCSHWFVRHRECVAKGTAAAVLLGVIIFLVVERDKLGDIFSGFIEWIKEYPPVGFFIFSLFIALSTVLFLPGSVVLLVTGFAFHQAFSNLGVAVLIAFAASVTGGQLGSITALIIGRFILQSSAERQLFRKYRILAAINRSIKHKGVKLIFLMRLCPIMPFLVLNYVFGVTQITVWQYFLAGFGMMPNNLAYVYLGTAISSVSVAVSGKKEWSPLQIGLVAGGSVFAIGIIVYITIVTKRYLYTNYESQIKIEDIEDDDNNLEAPLDGGEHQDIQILEVADGEENNNNNNNNSNSNFYKNHSSNRQPGDEATENSQNEIMSSEDNQSIVLRSPISLSIVEKQNPAAAQQSENRSVNQCKD